MKNNIKKIIWLSFLALLPILFQSCQPLNTNPPSDKVDNLSAIITTLKRIQMDGGEGSYAIFNADEQKNYYVQVAGSRSSSLLNAEAVSNKYLEPKNSLKTSQIATLKSIGWNPPSKNSKGSPNFSRDWEISNAEARSALANTLLKTLIDVYGFDNSMPINIKIEIIN